MEKLGLPVAFILTAAIYLNQIGATEPQEMDAVEFFSGVATWSDSLRNKGYRVYSYEIANDSVHCDFLGDAGFLNALGLLFRCKVAAILHFATVCSSWVTINRHTSGRSAMVPLGRQGRPYVAAANTMVSRMCMLIMIGACLGLDWVLEQPISSVMKYHPRMQVILNMAEIGCLRVVNEIHTWMGSFGASSPKPTMLIGTPSFLPRLHRKLAKRTFENQETSRTYEDKHGKKRFSGGKRLKETQQYPKGYGSAFAKLMEHADIDDMCIDDDMLEEASEWVVAGSECWADASLGGIWKIIRRFK